MRFIIAKPEDKMSMGDLFYSVPAKEEKEISIINSSAAAAARRVLFILRPLLRFRIRIRSGCFSVWVILYLKSVTVPVAMTIVPAGPLCIVRDSVQTVRCK